MKLILVLLSVLGVSQAIPYFLKVWPSRIVGGEPATEGQFPHQISLRYNNRHICGGSIVSPTKVVTAAHCCEAGTGPEGISSFTVVAGDFSLSTTDPTEQTKAVKELKVHPEYGKGTDLSNDICVAHLTDPIDLSKPGVGAIVLADPKDDPTGDSTCSGWGTTSESGSPADILRWVIIPLITNDECKKAYGSEIVPTMICAGIEKGGKDSCQGDSGGPLTAQLGGVNKLIGVVSWGIGCARPNYPGVYTRVSSFSEWVTNQ